MSLFMRLREMVTAHSHHALDEAENPHVMAQQILRDLGGDTARANRTLVTALGAVKVLDRQQLQARAEASQWRERAARMLETGREELARPALERALAAEARAEEQARPLEAAHKAVTRLQAQVTQLKSEWEHARARCAQIAANQNVAEALGAASRFGDQYSRALDRAQRLDRMSCKSAELDCEAEAAAELLSEHERLDREVARIDRSASVEAELATLRARVRPASA